MPRLDEPWNIFNMICSAQFKTSGDDVDWSISIDDETRKVWLIFKESNSKRDWKNNFRFPVKVYKKQKSCLRVASGWGDAWKSCNDEIMDAFIKVTQEHRGYVPVICGWSYGGAIALLAAEDFHFRTERFAYVMTFGAPKPLWGKKSQNYVHTCCYRAIQYAHINDVVPLLPPLPGYKRLSTYKCGKGRRKLKELLHPEIYHCIYGKEEIYYE